MKRPRIMMAAGQLAVALFLLSLQVIASPPPARARAQGAGNDQLLARLTTGRAGLGDVDPDYDLAALKLVSKVVLLTKENYVDQKRIKPREMLVQALKAIEQEVAEVLASESADHQSLTVRVGTREQKFAIGDVDSLWDVVFKLREIFKFLDVSLPADSDRPKVEYAAINGMLRSLDPHTMLLTPQPYAEMKMSTQGEFGGLGIVISIRDGKLTVVSPIDGTPAYLAGIRRKDQIVRIGEESTVNMGLEEAVKRLRGAPGTQVVIWILRDKSTEPRKYIITRARIKIVSVTSQLLEGGIGYVRIKNFQRHTASDLAQQMQTMAKKTPGGLKGLVLDLRDNPGGLLDQAIEVSDLFISSGVIVSTVGAGPRKDEKAHWSGTKSDIPIAVLVNGGSASASEIVSGAIKNDGRGVVIGEQTFGKGSVQVLYEFKKTALKLTIAQYLTPGDLSIQNVGITPDIEIQPLHLEKDNIDLYRDSQMMREADLDKHLVDKHIREQKPEFTLRYLAAKEKDDLDAAAVRNAENTFRSDFEIEFAQKLLSQSGAAERSAMLAKTGSVIAHITAAQEHKVVAGLKKLGVDWSIGDKQAGGKAVAKVIGLSEGQAGSPIPVEIEVENTGTAPLYRLRGTTKSKAYALSDMEFVFGKLMPGEKRRWTVPFPTRKAYRSRVDEVKVSFSEQYGRIPEALNLRVKVQARKSPLFAVTTLYDDHKGNGDGLLQRNESIDLRVAVRNLGPGDSDSLLVALQNKSGKSVYIQKGRALLKDLKVGETQFATLRFDVRADSGDQLKMQLSVFDQDLGDMTSTMLSPEVAERGPKRKPAKGIASSKKALSLRSAASQTSALVAEMSQGEYAKIIGNIGDYAVLDVADDLPCYAPKASLTLHKKSRRLSQKLKSKAVPKLHFQVQAPRVYFSQKFVGSETDSETIEIKGGVDSVLPLRDIIVFVNGDKVDYMAVTNPSKKTHDFHFVADLKQGPNLIQVAARVDEELQGRGELVIHRTEHEEKIVKASNK